MREVLKFGSSKVLKFRGGRASREPLIFAQSRRGAGVLTFWNSIILAAACLALLPLAARCADNDEVKFKPQTYTPRKESSTKAYSAKPYASSEKAAARPMGEAFAPAQARQPDTKPLAVKEPANSKSLEAPPPMLADPYVHGDTQTYVPTISPNKTMLSIEKKPYASTNTFKVGDAPYAPPEKPQEKPREKNPLLTPRQGIKELPVNDKP